MFLFAAFTLLIILIQINLFFKSLKSEKEGYLNIADAAQELNNKTLHDGAKKLFISNQLKYWLIYLALAEIIISIISTIVMVKK